MSDKITVEFDRKRLKRTCEIHKMHPSRYWCTNDCKQEDRDIIRCVLNGDMDCYEEGKDYKIKEQNNVK